MRIVKVGAFAPIFGVNNFELDCKVGVGDLMELRSCVGIYLNDCESGLTDSGNRRMSIIRKD